MTLTNEQVDLVRKELEPIIDSLVLTIANISHSEVPFICKSVDLATERLSNLSDMLYDIEMGTFIKE